MLRSAIVQESAKSSIRFNTDACNSPQVWLIVSVVPNYLEIVELVKNGLFLEAREKIMELREAVIVLQEENFLLKQKIKELEHNGDPGRNMVFEKGIYWLRKPTEDGSGHEGPFCQVCFDRDRKSIRLQRLNGPHSGWYCGACRNQF